jgi:hypothetical protein
MSTFNWVMIVEKHLRLFRCVSIPSHRTNAKWAQLAFLTFVIAFAPRTFAGADSSPATFNVKNYGAIGDGVADDTLAIQRAIHAAEAAGWGVVDFPGGTYLLNSNYPSSHPWCFFNLNIRSNVMLQGEAGARLLQGPGGRHALPAGALLVRNTMLAFGRDYTTIRFQRAASNGGFFELQPTTANGTSVTLSPASDAAHFNAGDYVAIYKMTTGDVIPTETSQVDSVNGATGVIVLKSPLARSFPAPSIANVTALAATNVGVQNMIVQGSEPLAVTETFGFRAKNCQFISDTSIGGHNGVALNLNTLHDFQFIDDIITSVGPAYAGTELAQRNSQYGVYDGNTFTVSSAGFGEYAAHIALTHNHFQLHSGPKVSTAIAIGGLDINFSNNDVHGGNITAGSGWGTILADYLGPGDYASYVGQIRITNNTFDCRADGNSCLGIFAADTSVIGNTITVAGSGCGIHAEGVLLQANRIQGNKLSMGSGDGMVIATPAAGGCGTVITDNTITGSGVSGIYVNAHGAANAGGIVISGNTITGFKNAGRNPLDRSQFRNSVFPTRSPACTCGAWVDLTASLNCVRSRISTRGDGGFTGAPECSDMEKS